MERQKNKVKLSVELSENCIKEAAKISQLQRDYINSHFSIHSPTESYESSNLQLEIQDLLQSRCSSEVFSSITAKSALYTSIYGNFKQSQSIANLLSYLQINGIIRPLTQKVREQFPEITLKNPLGIFSCIENQIWISHELSPFNLGAVLLHEVDHWSRSLVFSIIKKGLKQHQDFTHKEYNLLDESLSAFTSLAKQALLRMNHNREKANQVRTSRYKFLYRGNIFDSIVIKRRRSLQTEYDLNLYKKNGPIQQILKQEIRENGIEKDADFNDIILRLFKNKSHQKLVAKVLKIVQETYYPGESELAKKAEILLQYIIKNDELTALITPTEYISELLSEKGPSYINDLLLTRSCLENPGGQPGGEGVGLHDNDLKMNHHHTKACFNFHKKL